MGGRRNTFGHTRSGRPSDASSLVALDMDADGTSEHIAVSRQYANNAEYDVWRWSCEEEFVSMLTFVDCTERPQDKSPRSVRSTEIPTR